MCLTCCHLYLEYFAPFYPEVIWIMISPIEETYKAYNGLCWKTTPIWTHMLYVKEPVTVTSNCKAFGNKDGFLSLYNRDCLLSRGSHSMAHDYLGSWHYRLNREFPSISIGKTNSCHSFCLPPCVVTSSVSIFSAWKSVLRDVTPNPPSKVNRSSVDRDRAITAMLHNLFFHSDPFDTINMGIAVLLEKGGYVQGEEHEKWPGEK